jgi:long-chain-alcohol oxidase
MKAGLQALIAAGATSVVTLANNQDAQYEVDAGEQEIHSNTAEKLSNPRFQAYLQRVESRGVVDLQMATFSAHQMGSARLGAVPETSVLDPTGESWEVANLYCFDGSTFPTSLGINPMVTIEAVSYMLAGNLAASLSLRQREKMENSSGRRNSKRGAVQVEYDDGGGDRNKEIIAKL